MHRHRWWGGALAALGMVAAMTAGACGDDTQAGNGGASSTSSSAGGSTSSGEGASATLPSCGSDTPEALGACVEEERYLADLTAMEGSRSPGDPLHGQTRDLCAARFAEHGFMVEMHDYGSGVNVIGVKPGASDERILVSAHYDGVPNCPGADDNASGVAGVLETARVLGATAAFDRTLVVACWDEEELGLIGSRAYADRAAQTGEPIVGHYVYEMLGYFDDTPGAQSLPFGFNVIFPEETKIIEDNESRLRHQHHPRHGRRDRRSARHAVSGRVTRARSPRRPRA